MPREITVPKIKNSGTVTNNMAREIKPRARAFLSRRCNAMFCLGLSKGPRWHAPGNGPNQQPGERVDDQSQNEQNQCHLNQRTEVDVSHSLSEFACNYAGQ